MNVDPESDGESSDSSEIRILEHIQLGQEQDVATYSEINGEDGSVPMESTFDLTLPGSHSVNTWGPRLLRWKSETIIIIISTKYEQNFNKDNSYRYLGQNLKELRGRTLLDDGIYMNLPLLVQESVVLFPGQTLPMTVSDAQTISMLQTCIDNNRTFGVVCSVRDKIVPLGTTAEIYEYSGDNIRGFRLKAKGRQRFKILRVIIQDHGRISANVKVLPEVTLGPPLFEERLGSSNNFCTKSSDEVSNKHEKRLNRLHSVVTPWPAWVYRQYDPVRLSTKIRHHVQFIEKRGSNVPKDPIDLSYWVAQNILVDDIERIALLNYDCAISRLQIEMKYLVHDRIFVCGNCNSLVGKLSDMFPMSKEGPQSAYCNSGGFIHDTITLYRTSNLVFHGRSPSTSYSWFPGYAWIIANCRHCGTHMGWKFIAVQDNLKPESFWGLTRKSLKHKRVQKKNSSSSDGVLEHSDSEEDINIVM